MKIGIDCDECAVDFLGAVIKYHNATYKTNFKREDFHSYLFWEVWGCTREESIKKIHDFHRSEYSVRTEANPGAVEAIEKLAKEHELFMPTGRQDFAKMPTEELIQRLFPYKFSEICFLNDFSNNGKTRKKSDVCKEKGIDLLIDDYWPYAKDCAENGISVLLFDYRNYSWSKKQEDINGITVVKNWEAVVEYIKSEMNR